ncbi:MAG: hypothetical protein QXN59_01645 [Candidatus Micrarchaeaceae archaeon]
MENIRAGWDIYFHPASVSSRKMGVGDALKFYYQNTIIPVIMFIIIGAALVSLGHQGFGPVVSGLNLIEVTGVVSLVFGLLYFWVFGPISIFINALIYQLVGYNLLKTLKPNYEKSFAAVMFGQLPTMLLYWLVAIPIIGIVAIVILSIWNIVVFIISLATQHKIKRTDSVIVILTTTMLALVWVFVIFAIIYALALGAGLGTFGSGGMMGTLPYT